MEPNEHVDVAVLGDGLIGLSTAFHLRAAGFTVAVVGGPPTARASTAAAGMLTPACEYDPWLCQEFLDLLKAGARYYPEFLGGGWTTPDEVGYRRTDFTKLDLAERDEHGESLESRMEWMPKLGFDCEWLDPADVCRWEPNTSPVAFRGGIRIHDEALVNPIALWERLLEAVRERGVPVRPGPVTGLEERGERIAVSADSGVVLADRVVLAAGVWTADIARLAGLDVPLCPAKGEMVQLQGPPGLLNSVLFLPSGGCGSIVERSPGTYVVGTSEEYLEPHEHNTPGVIGTVMTRLCTVLPAAARWRIERMWTGFRPMTSDELPVLDVAEDPRFVVATGHHRNGILLGPLTGRIVAGLVEGATTELDLSPFAYGRTLRPHARFASKY
jgi:glycine oxidase